MSADIFAGLQKLTLLDFPGYVGYVGNTGTDEMFALRVRGESMIEIGILDGDMIIAEKTCYAENGEIVVALVENEATVKRFFREDGHYRLQPENKELEPIIVDEVLIIGKVLAIQRSYN
jgi:repressor LexA